MSRRPSRSNTKGGKNEALEKLKRARAGENPLDVLEIKEQDIYEEVEERDYVLRRQRDNKFIEDDDGSGYIDRGQKEEQYYDSEEDSKTKGKKKQKVIEEPKVNYNETIHKFFDHAANLGTRKIKIEGTDDLMNEISKDLDSELQNVTQSLSKGKNYGAMRRNLTSGSAYRPKAPQMGLGRRVGTLPSLKHSFANRGAQHLDQAAVKLEPGYTESFMYNSNEVSTRQPVKEELITPSKKDGARVTFDLPEDDMDFGMDFDIDAAMDADAKEESDDHGAEPAWKAIQNQLLESQIESEGEAMAEKPTSTEDFPKDSIYMYWIDAFAQEASGQVMLMGKIYDQDQNKYVSTCVIVNNMMRNVYFLPNPPLSSDADKETKEKQVKNFHMEVYPKFEKVYSDYAYSFKRVTRGYAFDTPLNIPRQSEYFKMTYPYLKRDCPFATSLKGKTFSHVFGSNTSALELFLVKRKIMGPCWLRIDNVTTPESKKSYCKIELHTNSPKKVRTLKDKEISLNQLGMPPLNIMSVSIKTVVNPATNANEIAMVNLVVFPNAKIDGDISTERRPAVHIGGVNQLSGKLVSQKFQTDLTKRGFQVEKTSSERALINYILSRVGFYDPDVFVGHNFLGYGLDVLLTRMEALKIPNWSMLGRLRRTALPKMNSGSNSMQSYNNRNLINGRLICDTYLGAKDAVKSKNYSLGQLSQDLLKMSREEINFDTVIQYYDNDNLLTHLFGHNDFDAYLSAALMFKLQLLPLAKQLTILAGNLWNHTLTGARARRNEFLLLHEFHGMKYICPDKANSNFESNDAVGEEQTNPTRRKATYSGGLVLDPKKGLYDHFVLLLDFNSLYPSIIQEFNICFTTIDRNPALDDLPDPPSKDTVTGLLPKLLGTLIERRSQVKKLLKDKNLDPAKAIELDIRQKALKLTANSMYGCLGYPMSRFYAKQLAMLITAKGRETLQSTVDLATNEGLEVVYGDTDSIMINTHVHDLDMAKSTANNLKKKVNQRYRNLEIDIDGIFKRLLLLQKKKYAALLIQELPRSNFKEEPKYNTFVEAKGLDLVRREFCGISQEISSYVLDQILHCVDCDSAVDQIHKYLGEISIEIREKRIPIEKFLIYKSISKPLDKYHDAESQPQVQVALRAQKSRGTPFMKGETVDYIICKSVNEEDNKRSYALRAYSLEEFKSQNKEIDFEWYFSRQILPPVARLCDVIEGTSSGRLAECLGLDGSKFATYKIDLNEASYDPLGSLTSSEDRYQNAKKLEFDCAKCNTKYAVESFAVVKDEKPELGVKCPSCDFEPKPYFLPNVLNIEIRGLIKKFQLCGMVCDSLISSHKVRGLDLSQDLNCPIMGCEGVVNLEVSSMDLYNQLAYYHSLFDSKSNLNILIKGGVSSDEAHKFLAHHSKPREQSQAQINHYTQFSGMKFVNLKKIFSF